MGKEAASRVQAGAGPSRGDAAARPLLDIGQAESRPRRQNRHSTAAQVRCSVITTPEQHRSRSYPAFSSAERQPSGPAANQRSPTLWRYGRAVSISRVVRSRGS